VNGGGTPYATGITYYPNGAVDEFTYGNLIAHKMTQNGRQLPATSRDVYGGTEFLEDSYSYDANGNVAAIDDTLTANRGDRAMTYDDLDRLTDVTSPMYGSTGAHYTYNALDDLTRVQVGGTAARDHYYCYDAGRLTNVKVTPCNISGSVIGLGYDLQGNLANKNGQLYVFDYGNRLREVVDVERYRYDAHGRRVVAMAFATGTVRSQYGLDGKLLYQRNDRTGKHLDHLYLGGSLVAIRETPTAGGTPTLKYQHTDALGSPVVVTGQNRAVLERSEYEPFGKVLNRPVHDGPGYTGHVEDAATGLLYAQQRYLDRDLGRFLSVDPVSATSIGGNFNRYWYADNNPYTFVDPDGRQKQVAWLVKLTADGFRKVARVTREHAIQARRSGDNIVADRRQVASGIETAAHGRNGQLKHAAHELDDGAKGLPHYQSEGKMGHSFWGKVSVAAASLATGLDQVAEAAEYIPDAAPRPAEQADVSRFNNTMGAISEATGVPMPGVKMGQDGGFQGVFRVEGRIDSQRLDRELDKKK